jgi:hypothetical protein
MLNQQQLDAKNLNTAPILHQISKVNISPTKIEISRN